MFKMPPADRRKAPRVDFSHDLPARMIAIDGTWHHACWISDISESGAKLQIDGSIAMPRSTEFFLLLSGTGTAHRRCELAWIDGDQLGVKFVRHPAKRTVARTASRPRG